MKLLKLHHVDHPSCFFLFFSVFCMSILLAYVNDRCEYSTESTQTGH